MKGVRVVKMSKAASFFDLNLAGSKNRAINAVKTTF
jgi:hypothetical protein